jgi:hypothetical protein
MQNVDMKRASNDNFPLLTRHPRLLAKAHERDCNREREPESNREKNSEDDASRELAMIYARIKWLNWMEFALRNKRTAANDSQVRLSQSGREMAS